MLRLLTLIIKGAVFALIVLIVANYAKVGQRTVADQVKTQLAHAERSGLAGKVRQWAGKVSMDAKNGFQTQLKHSKAGSTLVEDISSSERQKLKNLIHELNGSK